MIEYKGYLGKIEFDDESNIFHGEVINIRDVITFQGESVIELRKAFNESIDDYLAFCKERGEEPERPLSGKFVLRTSPDIHRKVFSAARRCGKSLNTWAVEQLEIASDKNSGYLDQNTKTVTCNPNEVTLQFVQSYLQCISATATKEGVSVESYLLNLITKEHEQHKIENAIKELSAEQRGKQKINPRFTMVGDEAIMGMQVISTYDMDRIGESYGKIALTH